MPRRGVRVGLAVALVLATALLYARGLANDFVSLDDPGYVGANPIVRAGLTAQGVAWAFGGSFHFANWHPLTWLSHMADVQLFGLDAGLHHATSAGLHALNALLLLSALVRLTRDWWPSLFVAAVFAFHPLHVESVAWISERKDVLSGLFWLSTLLAWAHYRSRPSPLRYGLVLTGFGLALLAKPMAVTLPCVLLLLDVWPLERLRRGTPVARLVLEKLPLLLLAGAFSLVTLLAQRGSGSLPGTETLGLEARIANALLSYGTYLRDFAWPVKLACFYPHPALVADDFSPLRPSVLSSLLLLVAISLAAWVRRRQRPWLLVGWLWFTGMLLPVIGLLQVGAQARADRYTYLPLIGLAIAIAWSVRHAILAVPRLRTPVAVSAVLLVLAWIGLSWRQIGTWKDSPTLYAHALEVTERNYVVHANYGIALEAQGRVREAEEQYRQALAIRPHFPRGLINLGALLHRRGDLATAEALYARALALAPKEVTALNNLAVIAAGRGDVDAAIGYLERAVQVAPDDAEALESLAQLHAVRGDDEAAARVRRRLEQRGARPPPDG